MTGRLANICRHPIKGHGREELASVRLLAGEGLPWDRLWAVAHEAAKLRDGWSPCANFARGAKAPQLMAITCALDEEARSVTLRHPVRGEITIHPDAAEDLPAFLDWVGPLNPPERAQPARIVSAGVAMTDSAFPSISIVNLASLAELSAHVGIPLSAHRFRANLWVEGWKPWQEWEMIGRRLHIGDTVLEVRERITRCNATKVDLESGIPNTDTLGTLEVHYGHRDFGVYATVVQGGKIAVDQEIVLQ